MRNQGFTLIEILIVVAIIGVLSAVVLASLGTARNKGSDASIQVDMHTLITQAEIYYNSVGAYSYGTQTWLQPCTAAGVTGGMFTADGTFNKALNAADNANGTGILACASNGTSYVVVAQLLVNTATYWCIDSKGSSKQVTTAPGTTAAGAGTYLVGGVYGCYNN